MSDDKEDPSVLGKRGRNGEGDTESMPVDEPVPSAHDEESDDDVGPMPVQDTANGAPKKKRKSMYRFAGMQTPLNSII